MGIWMSSSLMKTADTLHNYLFPYSSLSAVGLAGVTLYFIYKRLYMFDIGLLKGKDKNIVFITGCDSGIGFSIACHCHKLGFHVIAGVLDENSEGAQILRRLNGSDIVPLLVLKINVAESSNITKCAEYVKNYISENAGMRLYAVVNNAGVMVFGEIEWQTELLIKHQINVNLIGPILVTKSFLPLLRKFKGRVINVTSHCALEPLPGLSVYSASKSGLQAFTNSTRVEYAKYGVKIISFIPGSFFNCTKILSNQHNHAAEMYNEMDAECRQFYGQYFHTYNGYLDAISLSQKEGKVNKIEDKALYNNFTHALLSEYPKSMYINSPLYYRRHHFLFNVLPTPLRDRLVEKFMKMPKYEGVDSAIEQE